MCALVLFFLCALCLGGNQAFCEQAKPPQKECSERKQPVGFGAWQTSQIVLAGSLSYVQAQQLHIKNFSFLCVYVKMLLSKCVCIGYPILDMKNTVLLAWTFFQFSSKTLLPFYCFRHIYSVLQNSIPMDSNFFPSDAAQMSNSKPMKPVCGPQS